MRSIMSGVPIVGITGSNGSGKTLLAVEDAIDRMASGQTVYSTLPIAHEVGRSRPIRSLRELVTITDSHILLDEISVILPSGSSTVPNEIRIFLHTLRHKHNTLVWTAPGWMRAHNELRLVTQANLAVSPLIKVGNGTPWPTPLIVMAGLLDTVDGEPDATPTKVLRRRLVRPRGLRAWGAYDTYADTPKLGGLFPSGTCPDCGGRYDTHKHSEARHDELGIPFFPDDFVHLADTRSDGFDLAPVAAMLNDESPPARITGGLDS
jgi:hypothetical protein